MLVVTVLFALQLEPLMNFSVYDPGTLVRIHKPKESLRASVLGVGERIFLQLSSCLLPPNKIK